MKLTPVVDFIDMFNASFQARRSQKCKKTVKSARLKALGKMLLNSTPGVYFINLSTRFFWLEQDEKLFWANNGQSCRESCGLVVENSAHDRKIVGSFPVQSNARWKWC
jgi:hypothetical protein